MPSNMRARPFSVSSAFGTRLVKALWSASPKFLAGLVVALALRSLLLLLLLRSLLLLMLLLWLMLGPLLLVLE